MEGSGLAGKQADTAAMGRGGADQEPKRGAAVPRPNFDHLITIGELGDLDRMADAVSLPIRQAQKRGVFAWTVSDRDHCFELTKRRASPINLHDLPVPVALEAWMAQRLQFDDVMVVLAARNQLQKPGDEGVEDDNDGHYVAHCWCGWESELHIEQAVVARELDDHTRITHGHAARVSAPEAAAS